MRRRGKDDVNRELDIRGSPIAMTGGDALDEATAR